MTFSDLVCQSAPTAMKSSQSKELEPVIKAQTLLVAIDLLRYFSKLLSGISCCISLSVTAARFT